MRLRSLSVRGFRAYGVQEQTLRLSGDLSVVWAPNSRGKTSLAEALEFLLTGRIARRELTASTKDEFADSLRNAHLPDGEDAWVSAVLDVNGQEHTVRRTLVADFGKRDDCVSKLEVDGVEEGSLARLGVHLSPPPLTAPILAQHTISYVFSIGPQDRAMYFKSLLDLLDLETFRADLDRLAAEVSPPQDPLLDKLDSAVGEEAIARSLSDLATEIPSEAELGDRVSTALAALIQENGRDAPDGLGDRRLAAAGILDERRSRTFPIHELADRTSGTWMPPDQSVWDRLARYQRLLAEADKQTRLLTNLFIEALAIPEIADAAQPSDCPLCGTQEAITADRVRLIREHGAITISCGWRVDTAAYSRV